MAKKILNFKQATCLLKDILKQDVKKFGSFIIGKYSLTLYNNKHVLTGRERVDNYYKRNPNKLIEQYEKRKKEYHYYKGKGICVKCKERKAIKNRILCSICNKNDLKAQTKRRLKLKNIKER